MPMLTVSWPNRTVARFLLIVVVASATLSGAVAWAGPASAQSSVRYVALGDSYSAGLGAGSYIGSSGSCHRSTKAYPELWAAADAPASFSFVACSGATTASVTSGQLGTLTGQTTLVSITVGGNDVGFATVMETCVLSPTSTCVAAIEAAEAKMTQKLPAELDAVLSDIASRAPHARVVILGYPELYDLSKSATCLGLSTTDRKDLNAAADVLDGQLMAAALRHGDVFGDVRPAFAGHEICDSSSWLYRVNILDISESFHPTATGQARAYEPTFATAVG